MTAPALAHSPLGHEALDDPGCDPALAERMLCDIARSNRWLGGRHAVRHALRRLLGPADRGARLTLLDIGTGAGDLPADAVRWAARRGVTLVPFGIERLPVAARLASAAGVTTMVACAGALPLRSRAVDLVLVSQVAHHLDDRSISRLVSECARLARRGVILADLRPSRLAALAFPLAGRLLGLHRTTVTDGITSLARGFTRTRLTARLAAAGIAGATVTAQPGARIVAWWRTDR